MVDKLVIVRGRGFDPYENLALEEALTESLPAGLFLLYLWQNQNTVVIGRNQNAWKECRVSVLESEGGRLARRLSGGGAVFHDLGNLNFTFITCSEDYDLDRQLSVIEGACRSLGIEAERSGRNDILASGRKFSGNAFYNHNGRSYHHGTLLISVDQDKLARYLKPSEAKLRARGVDSVRSRVVNLAALRPGLTPEELASAMEESFEKVFGMKAERIVPSFISEERVRELTERNSSWEWNFGRDLPLDAVFEKRFPWGEIRLELGVAAGVISAARVYTDSMDWTLASKLSETLEGARFGREEMISRLRSSDLKEKDDIVSLLLEQDI